MGVSLVYTFSKGVQNLVAIMEILPRVLNTKSGGKKRTKTRKQKTLKEKLICPALTTSKAQMCKSQPVPMVSFKVSRDKHSRE